MECSVSSSTLIEIIRRMIKKSTPINKFKNNCENKIYVPYVRSSSIPPSLNLARRIRIWKVPAQPVRYIKILSIIVDNCTGTVRTNASKLTYVCTNTL